MHRPHRDGTRYEYDDERERAGADDTGGSMATAQKTQVATQEQRLVLHNISWGTYERLLADHESAPRFTYDRGELEIMSPMREHEQINRAIASLVEIVAEVLGVEYDNLGSMTFKRRDLERGFEPDSCFYV